MPVSGKCDICLDGVHGITGCYCQEPHSSSLVWQPTLKEEKFCNTTCRITVFYETLWHYNFPDNSSATRARRMRYQKSFPFLTTVFFLLCFTVFPRHLSWMCPEGSQGQGALQCPLPPLFVYKHDYETVLTFASMRWWHFLHHFPPHGR